MIFSRRMRASGIADGTEQFMETEFLDKAFVGPFSCTEVFASLAAPDRQEADEPPADVPVDVAELQRSIARAKVVAPAPKLEFRHFWALRSVQVGR